MYQIPLRFIRASKDVAVCATRVTAIMSCDAFQARRVVKQERDAGTLINACGRKKMESVIFLDNGTVISSPFSVRDLMSNIEKSNQKDRKPSKNAKRLSVYDVVDAEPSEDALLDDDLLAEEMDSDYTIDEES